MIFTPELLRFADGSEVTADDVDARRLEILDILAANAYGRFPPKPRRVTGDMEGTGVNVERPYLLRFDDNGYASIANSIDPYEMQQALCKVLTYSINGQEITFYGDGKELAKATNKMEDMGGFMDDAIYIGEQISYSIEGPITVHVTPGVNFVVGKVLHYDDMPTISATVTLKDDGGFSLSDFKAEQ